MSCWHGQVFGEHTVQCLYSKAWGNRQKNGLDAIKKGLEDGKYEAVGTHFPSPLLRRLIGGRVVFDPRAVLLFAL